MTDSTVRGGSSPARDEIARIVAENKGRLAPTDEEAHAILAAHGIRPPKPGSPQSVYTQPEHTVDAYNAVSLDGPPLPEGIDQAKLLEGAKALGYGLQLDPIMAGGIAKDMAHAGQVDPDQVKAAIEKTPNSYDELVRLVDIALSRASLKLGKEIGIKAAELPALTLLQLGTLERLKAKSEGRL